MNLTKATNPLKQQLPEPVFNALLALAEKYRTKGIQLFIFGSFARGEGRQSSDLDLGVEWNDGRNDQLFHNLCEDVLELPTIRKIDVVDMEQADASFRKIATKDRIML